MVIRKNTAGFTLVEIMIVVAIIGLLAAIAVPNFINARQSARANVRANNIRMISAAKDQAALELGLDETDTPTTGQLSAYLKGGAMPTDPLGGTYNVNAVSVEPSWSA